MPDDMSNVEKVSEKVGSVLSLVPQVFFDLIARLIPGLAITAFSISISYSLNAHPCRQRVADLLHIKVCRTATLCRQ